MNALAGEDLPEVLFSNDIIGRVLNSSRRSELFFLFGSYFGLLVSFSQTNVAETSSLEGEVSSKGRYQHARSRYSRVTQETSAVAIPA